MFRYLLFSLYLLIPYLPLFGEIDRIGSQILFLSILNFISLGSIFYLKEQTTFFELFKKKEILFYGFFLISALISGINAINISEFLIEFLRTVTFFISLLIFLILIKSEKHKNFLIWLISLTLLFDIFGLLVQNFQGLSMIGFTANKNIAAFSLSIKCCYLFFLINRYKSYFIRVIFLVVYCIVVFALISINSKGAIISLFASILYFLIIGFYFYKLNKSLLFNSLIILLITLSTIFITGLKENSFNAINNTTLQFNTDAGNTSRIRYLNQAFNSFKESPFLGVGYGNWKISSIKYDASEMRNYVVQYYTHNDFIQILTETGIFGFFFYLMIFCTLLFKSLKKIFKSRFSEQNNLIIYVGMALLIYMFDALINFPAFRVTSQLNLIIIMVLINFKQKNEE